MTLSNMLLCASCAGELTDLPVEQRERIGAVNRVYFQKIYDAAGARNSFTLADATLVATWQTANGLATDSKVTFSPIIVGAISDPVDAIEVAGGNDSFGGIPEIGSVPPQKFGAKLANIKQSTNVKPLKDYIGCEVGVYIVNECGAIWGEVDGTDIYPIKIKSFYVSDKGLGGREGRDENMLSWYFPPKWSNDLGSVTPVDFDALSNEVYP